MPSPCRIAVQSAMEHRRIESRKMDTSTPAVFISGREMLQMYSGRRVRTVIHVVRIDGMSIIGKSSDGNELIVRGCPSFPPSHFVEVIGIADAADLSVRSEISTDFGVNFDMLSYNKLCQLANGEFKHLFI
ncbi:Replication protein A 14 kDa subunit B [Zostera marina]|uniref:Replication protein A 14 kDa subunit B n=1 Tax=Zostera marina TaxID=29655 RepID=A0A0K9P2A7_ZOSMR|nr:Replication protein A 14 kDa subunit B [Zostera marina]